MADAPKSPVRALPRERQSPPGPFSALRHRDFRVLLISTMAQQVGAWVQTIALGWLVLHDLHGSATDLGIVAVLRGAALLLLSPVGGYLCGRLERRRQLVIYTSASATIAFALAVLIGEGAIRPWMVYLVSPISGATEALAAPLRLALVYDAVDKENLTNAVALNSLAGNAMRVVGPAIGGVLIGAVGTDGAFQLQAAALVVAALVTLRVRPNQPDRSNDGNGMFRSIGAGLRYIGQDRAMLVIVLTAIIPSLLIYPYVTYLPVFARDVMHSGGSGYGFLAAGVGLGSLAGGVIVVTIIGRGPAGRRAMVACMIYCAVVVGFTLTRSIWAGVLVLALAGLFHSIYAAVNSSQMQLQARTEFRPRSRPVKWCKLP